jgi:hypothetical protein
VSDVILTSTRQAEWRQQPVEQIRLLNPAFLGALLYCAAKGYEDESDQRGLPYALAFVAAPAVLQKATRDQLPRAISTTLAAWLSVNPSVLVGFSDRAKAIAPLVRHSIAASCAGGLLCLDSSQVTAAASIRRLNNYRSTAGTTEVLDCTKKAYFVGRWFAASGDYKTVMALWGVRP